MEKSEWKWVSQQEVASAATAGKEAAAAARPDQAGYSRNVGPAWQPSWAAGEREWESRSWGNVAAREKAAYWAEKDQKRNTSGGKDGENWGRGMEKQKKARDMDGEV